MNDRLVGGSAVVVRCAWAANLAFLVCVTAGLAISMVWRACFDGLLAGTDAQGSPIGVRLLMVVGVVMAVATDRLLVALRGMIACAQAGDPFVADNAGRLRVIGWALLVLQLLDLCAMGLDRLAPGMGSAAPDGGVSVGGWMAVLLVFVLSRIFADGAAMRDDLQGTV